MGSKTSYKKKGEGKNKRERKKIEIVQIFSPKVQISGLQLRIRLENKKSCLITSNSTENYALIVGFFAMLTSQTERFNKDLVKNADFSLILMADCKGRVYLVTWYILTFAFRRRSESNGNIHGLLQYINNFIYHV